MEMQDKDFDKLFHSKLDDFEMQPSAGVWEGIDRELRADKRRKLLIPFLSAAASVVVLITAGIWFIPKMSGVNTKGSGKNTVAVVTKPAVVTAGPKKQAIAVPARINQMPVAKVTPVRTISPTEVRKDTATPIQSLAGTVNANAPKRAPEEVIAAVSQPPQPAITKAVVPGSEVPLAVKNPSDVAAVVAEQPQVQLPAKENQEPAPVKARHKVRTLGGLLNLAIAKVDKRKDKVIEFAETDDEESNVTAVNLGIIKIKKEK